jgi:CelD/BcsL family acetyltransferase involved in cellulose biosynthesis
MKREDPENGRNNVQADINFSIKLVEGREIDVSMLDEFSHHATISNPFITKHWLQRRLENAPRSTAWLQVFADGVLVAIFPFQISRLFGVLPVATSLRSYLYDYDDVVMLASDMERSAALLQVLDFISASRSKIWLIRGVLGSSLPSSVFTEHSGSMKVISERRYRVVTENDWKASISKRLRKNIEYDIRRLERLGALSLSVSAKVCDEQLQQLIQMKALNLRAQHRMSVMFAAYYQHELSTMHSDNPGSVLYSLSLDNEVIAMALCVKCEGYIGYQIPAYSLAHSKYGPSNVLLYKLLEHELYRQKTLVFDLMRGAEAYKSKWLINGEVDPIVLVTNLPSYLLNIAIWSREKLAECKKLLMRT